MCADEIARREQLSLFIMPEYSLNALRNIEALHSSEGVIWNQFPFAGFS